MRSNNLHYQTPIIDAILSVIERKIVPLHTPGHKGGTFFPDRLKRLLGKTTLSLDVPSWELTDNTFCPTGCIKKANDLAAILYGAGQTRFLTSGSTIGIAAIILAAIKPGETVLLPRNIHQSVFSALVLSGAKPKYLVPNYAPVTGALGITAKQISTALRSDPTIRAVLITRPTYYGLASKIDEIIATCNHYHIPLLVDEAHGAHLKFLPDGAPKQALDFGADLVVQSPHKTITAMVGGAQLHIGRTSRISPERVQAMLNLLQTTSPSYLILASLDACRAMLAKNGTMLFAQACREADKLRTRIEQEAGMQVLRQDSIPDYKIDPLRLVVHTGSCGITGYEAQKFLRNNFCVEPELCDSYNLVFVLTPIEQKGVYNRLVQGLIALRKQRSGLAIINTSTLFAESPLPQSVLTPREAAFSEKKRTPISQAAGCICGETITFYPPGIPLLVPGEIIDNSLINYCISMKKLGAHPYAIDPTLKTIITIDENLLSKSISLVA